MGLTSSHRVGIFVCMERDFYRIECEETGLGPYQSGEYDCVKTPSTSRHPTPWSEGLWDHTKGWDEGYYEDQRSFVCGFESVQQLLAWFDINSLKNMLNGGLRYHRHYNVIHFRSPEEHMRVAVCQAVARKPYLIEVSRQELSAFIYSVQIPESAKALTFSDPSFTLVS